MQYQRLPVVLVLGIFHDDRVHADLHHAVALLDQLAFRRDEDIVAIQKECALLAIRPGSRIAVELQGDRRRRRPALLIVTALFYTVLTVIGSLTAHHVLMRYVEKGRRKVGG